MRPNSILHHRNVALHTLAAVEAPIEVTSAWIDEQLAESYERNGLEPGTLSELAGIRARRWWDEEVTFDRAAAMAGRKAIDTSGIDPSLIGMLISTSVCKHHLEPSVASAVHNHLDLATGCLNFDLGNACLGFINGMQVAAAAIDAGNIDYALIVDGEGSRHTQLATIERLQRPETTAADLYAEFASLTLGSGAAAAIICRADEHPDAHRMVGGIAYAATEHHELCVGDLDRMTTDTGGLLAGGLEAAEHAWKNSGEYFDWEEGLDWYVLHQISQVHTQLVCERMGVPLAKVPLTFPEYGNVGPAAIPITLDAVQDRIQPGDRIACMGMGSGINASISEIVW